jgi:CDP-diacylglycerol--glycerol-3-phosphate 3-phosphatidyltransferase
VVLSPPEVLIAFRAFSAPAIFALACFGFPRPLLAGVLLAAFLSDVFDGIVARRLGLATAALRHADTLVDTVFYVSAAVAMRIAVPDVFDGCALPLSLLVAVHVSRATFELVKFGRLASYHMWSSKALGALIVVTMTAAFATGRPSALVVVALWMGVANELEGFAASAVLPAWTADVPSLAHAVARSRPQQIHGGPPCPRPDDAVGRQGDDGSGAAGGGRHGDRLDWRDAVEDRRGERHQREA